MQFHNCDEPSIYLPSFVRGNQKKLLCIIDYLSILMHVKLRLKVGYNILGKVFISAFRVCYHL